jgi:hypothetical protein
VPQITSVTPTTITPPAQLAVTGTALDRVSQARLGTTVLPIAAQTATSLALDVPAGASTGFLSLVDSAGTVRQSAQQITVIGPVSISSFSPASVLTGNSLTINGTGLDRASTVEFAGGASASIAARSGSTSITVTVPAAAQSGPVVVVTSTGERTASAGSLSVVPRIVVSNAGNFAVAAGASVTLTGSGFTEVSGVTVAGQAAALGARSATQLSFTVPAGVTCGTISLQSASQPAVFGGSVTVGSGCSLRVESIEFAQVLSQPPADARQRLVPQRETWVRAYVVSQSSGLAAPTVQVSAYNGSTLLGTRTMSGPATVPVLAAGSPLPDAMRNSGAQSYNARLDEAWVGAGLNVRVTVDPEQRLGAAINANSTPTVGTGTRIDLVLVPLVSGANAPAVSSTAITQALDELTRRMPVARENISVSVRAQPYTLTSVTDGVDTSADWSNALSELERLRRLEAPNRHYYGLVQPMVSAGTAGIGYVNNVGSSSPALSSLGWDTSRSSWLRTLVHELGHNFSRSHAPCGSVGSSDPNYPYVNGALGPTPLFDVLADAVVSPAGLSDVMGYCNGAWFSDYNLREVQRFLEARPQTAPSVQALAATAGEVKGNGEMLVVSGVIGLDGVRLAPVQAVRGEAMAGAAGEYLLRLKTAAGGEFELPFDAVLVDHAMPPERHFIVSVPNPGPLAALELLRGGSVIARRTAPAPASETVQATSATRQLLTTQETAGELVVEWDAARYPFASVAHIGPGGRSVQALDAQGGRLRLSTAGLAGGEFELSLSDGLNSRVEVIRR